MASTPNAILSLTAVAALIIFTSTSAQADNLNSFGAKSKPKLIWSEPVGENDVASDEIDGISVDNDGNTIISGIFRGELRVGQTTLKSRGEGDIFLVKFSRTGKLLWQKHIGGVGDDNTFDLTTDNEGNIYSSGWFSDSVDFGGKVAKSKGGSDQFLAKHSPSGELLWIKTFGGASNDGGNEVSVLDNGEIAVSAMTDGDFQAGSKSFKFGGGRRDAYVLRLSPKGDVRWIKQINGPGFERIRALSFAPTGDVVLGFTFRGSLTIEDKVLQAQGNWDGAAACLNSKGKLMWLKQVSSAGEDNVRGIGVSPDGLVFASGLLSGPGKVLGTDITGVNKKGDDFLVVLELSGKVKSTIMLRGPGKSTGPELQVDSKGVFLSAVLDGSISVHKDGKEVSQIKSIERKPTSYLIALDINGNPRFCYSPSPQARRSGALGDVLSVSRNGKYVAQGLRFRGSIEISGKAMTTPSKKDSAVLFIELNGR